MLSPSFLQRRLFSYQSHDLCFYFYFSVYWSNICTSETTVWPSLRSPSSFQPDHPPPPPRLQTATCCSEKGRPWPAYFLSCDSDEDWCHTLEKRSLGRTPRVEVSNRTQQTKGGLKCHLSGQGFSGGGVEWDSKCVVWASETNNFRNSFYTRQQV